MMLFFYRLLIQSICKLGLLSHLSFAVRGASVRRTSVLGNVILMIVFAALQGVLGWRKPVDQVAIKLLEFR